MKYAQSRKGSEMFKNLSIKKRIVVFSFAITLVPLLILEIVLFVFIQNNAYKTIMNAAESYADQLAENYQTDLSELEQIAESIVDFTALSKYLNLDFSDRGEEFRYYLDNIHPFLHSCNNAYRGTKVKIYHNKEQIHNYSFEVNNNLDGYIERYFENNGKPLINGQWQSADVQYFTYHSALSYSIIAREKTAPYEISYMVTAHLNEEKLFSQIANEPVGERLIFVTDKDGFVLTSNQRDAVGMKLEDLGVPKELPLKANGEKGKLKIGTNQYYCISRSTPNLDIFYLVSSNLILTAQNNFLAAFIGVGAVLLCLSLLITIKVADSITAGIERLKEKMREVNLEQIHMLAVSETDQNTEDEIEQLNAVFSGMMSQIEKLINDVEMKESQLKDEEISRQKAEIMALQRQIDPHYVFNTLEAIRMNLIAKNDREDAEIVKLFAESFRRYVDMRADTVTLREEVEFVRKFIRIQNFRLCGKIAFTVNAQESLLNYRVLKLLIQPLVENAICHGIEPKDAKGSITMRVYENGRTLVVSVRDDGIGIPEDNLEEIEWAIATGSYRDPNKRSVGMCNVAQRLRFAYGSEAALEVLSDVGVGTESRLILPIDELEGGLCSEY